MILASRQKKSAFHIAVMAGLLLADADSRGFGRLVLTEAIVAFPEALRTDRDGSLGEILNYTKWIALAGIPVMLFVSKGK